MTTIPIFSAEKKAGLENKIQNTTKATCFAPIKLIEPFPVKIEASQVQAEDLYFLDSILVSTGWNGNDDIFLPYETWAARKTPEDKQFNYGHDCSDIIGHIINVNPVNEEYKTIADNTSLDELPSKFHLLTKAVIYKTWSKQELQERMDKIIAEIPQGIWFVSMEALFTGFDYGLIDAAGQHTIVARNEETAFLTSHLRAYGGEGKYDNYKVGRVVRNIVFSGKGLVQNPANPESIIFAERNSFVCNKIFDKKEKTGYNLVEENTLDSEKVMANENDNKLVDQLQAKVKELESKLAEVDVKALKNELTKAQEANKALVDDKSNLEKEFDALKADKSGLEKEVKEYKEKIDKLQSDLEKIEQENKVSARLVIVKDKLGMDEQVAKAFVEDSLVFSDEVFEKQVASILTIKKTETDESLPETDKAEANAKTDDLEKVETENKPDLVVAEENRSEELRKQIADRYSKGEK